MSRNKRQRDIKMDESDDGMKKKLGRTSSCVITNSKDQDSVTHFEDFSNEVIYEIFEYIDVYQIYDTFSKLNKRFENLLLYSTFPLKMNIPSLSKSTFERYYKEIIISNKHRIRSLHLSDPFTIELFFYINDNISIYSKLETLILPYVDSQYLKNLLQRLASLPKLSSLSILIGDELYREYIYHLIFQLPVLKSCKISLHKDTYFTSIPRCTITPSPIENLIINGRCDYNAFDAILSYVSQLRCLSINNLCRFTNQGTSLFKTILHNLTNVSLTMNHIHFDHIEPLFKKSFNHVKILQISSSGDRTCLLDADRWERLIVSYMPYLHIFNFEHKSKILSYDVDENIYQPLLDKFSSPFWCQRQWFFTHESNCEVHSHGIFYSTGPYRRKSFRFINPSNHDEDECDEKTSYPSVDHVMIDDGRVITDSLKYFPNATKLSLCNNRNAIFHWPTIDELDGIIPLNQLTKIIVDLSYLRCHRLIRLLKLTPNVHTLVFNSIRSNEADLLTSQPQKSIFRLVSSQNQIKNLIFKKEYSMTLMKVLIQLCPNVQHISIGVNHRSFQPTVRFLLSKRRKVISHLSSLYIVHVSTIDMERIQTLIKSKKHLVNHSIKIINNDFYLWW